jgi:hypothetical protein
MLIYEKYYLFSNSVEYFDNRIFPAISTEPNLKLYDFNSHSIPVLGSFPQALSSNQSLHHWSYKSDPEAIARGLGGILCKFNKG